MAGAYATDLRRSVLAAVEAGESFEAAARRFVVGRSAAYRWVAAARGGRAARGQADGRRPGVSA